MRTSHRHFTLCELPSLETQARGKTTLAGSLARDGVAVLDLDTIAWEPNAGAIMRPLNAARRELRKFCSSQSEWIVEGCYGDLIEAAFAWRPELVFLNPGEEICLRNCRNRQWEPHKYRSKGEQDSSLEKMFFGYQLTLRGGETVMIVMSNPCSFDGAELVAESQLRGVTDPTAMKENSLPPIPTGGKRDLSNRSVSLKPFWYQDCSLPLRVAPQSDQNEPVSVLSNGGRYESGVAFVPVINTMVFNARRRIG